MRLFLANYLMNAKTPLPINQVHRFGLGDAVPALYHRVAGKDIDHTSSKLTLSLRNKVMRGIVANNADVNFVKTHNINRPSFGVQLIEPKFTKVAIYIMRNPLDMVLSYARHFGLSHERAVEAITSSQNATAADERSVWQYLGSWSEHVKTWTESKSFPVVTLRYEDMLAEPEIAFSKALEGFGLTPEPERLAKAIEFASFKEATKQESEKKFVENSPHTDKFFNKGQSGQWRTDLAPELVKKVRQANKHMMKKYGYYNA